MIDCMACLVAEAQMRAADGPVLILGAITHATYADWLGQERLTCRFDRKINFRMFWYDAVIRAMRGLRPRQAPRPSVSWARFKMAFRKLAKKPMKFPVRYGP